MCVCNHSQVLSSHVFEDYNLQIFSLFRCRSLSVSPTAIINKDVSPANLLRNLWWWAGLWRVYHHWGRTNDETSSNPPPIQNSKLINAQWGYRNSAGISDDLNKEHRPKLTHTIVAHYHKLSLHVLSKLLSYQHINLSHINASTYQRFRKTLFSNSKCN